MMIGSDMNFAAGRGLVWRRLGRRAAVIVMCGVTMAGLASPAAMAQQQQPVSSVVKVTPDQQAFLQQSERFVAQLSNVAIQELVNPAVPRETRVVRFRQILQSSFDIDNVSRFVLGRYWRMATPEQRIEYRQLFEKLLVRLYEEKFQSYNGQTLTVTGSRLASGGDFALVSSRIKDPAAPQPINVEWRVVKGGGKPRIADVAVEGISMTLSQRQEFAAVIQRNGGSVESLLKVMRESAGRQAG
jgi:phospholipid transport system substrate-binding protein